jgi:Fe-S cluster assembly scaffold IscU
MFQNKILILRSFARNKYSKVLVNHFEKPQNVGSFDKTLKNIGTAIVGAPACGDVMKLQIKVNPLTNIIEDAKFKTFGCGSAIASSSYATQYIKNMNLDEAKNVSNSDIAKYLNLPPVKLHCSMLAEDAIKIAINDYKNKK